MPVRRTLMAFVLVTSVVAAADLRIQKDGAVETISGDLVSLDDKNIVLKKGADEITVPIDQVLTLDLKPDDKLFPRDAKYTTVELTDGSMFQCAKVSFKGKEAHLTLVAGQEVKVPLAVISYWIGDAHDAKVVQQVQTEFLGPKRRGRDVLIARSADGRINGLEGTLGAADDKGETFEFALTGSDVKRQVAVTKAQGMVFVRTPDPNMQPPVCKLTDNHRNVVMASTLALGPAGLAITTPAGARIEYAPALVSRLDYSKGKLTYLSDLSPIEVVETNNLDRVEHYRKDQSLEGEKITLRLPEGEQKYDKGLSLHAYTALTYRLDGDYQFFSAVIGVDDTVGGSDGPVLIRIEGDGKEIKTYTITRKDKAVPLRLPVRDVFRLKVVVASGDLLDLGKHVSLADAKLSKQ